MMLLRLKMDEVLTGIEKKKMPRELLAGSLAPASLETSFAVDGPPLPD